MTKTVKTVIIILFLTLLFAAGFAMLAGAAKVVNVTTTKITNVNVINNEDGQVSVNGEIIDSVGNVVNTFFKIYTFDELPPQIRENLNNVMRHLSRDMNNLGADEDSETWINK
jgi:LPS O-antigen subunit length determinant protein (WzzB/FepE family)